MKLWQEFKEFAMKGSVVDLAVGVIIGGAFGGIVQSLVKDVIMPPLGILMGGVDFADKVIVLRHAHDNLPEADLRYGMFVNQVITFFIVAASIFLVIKLMNAARRKPAEVTPTTKPCPMCTSVIPIAARKCPLCTADLAM